MERRLPLLATFPPFPFPPLHCCCSGREFEGHGQGQQRRHQRADVDRFVPRTTFPFPLLFSGPPETCNDTDLTLFSTFPVLAVDRRKGRLAEFPHFFRPRRNPIRLFPVLHRRLPSFAGVLPSPSFFFLITSSTRDSPFSIPEGGPVLLTPPDEPFFPPLWDCRADFEEVPILMIQARHAE